VGFISSKFSSFVVCPRSCCGFPSPPQLIFFREKTNRIEVAGILLIVAAILLLLAGKA